MIPAAINRLRENPDLFREVIFTELNNKYNKAIEYKKMKEASRLSGIDCPLNFKADFLTAEDY